MKFKTLLTLSFLTALLLPLAIPSSAEAYEITFNGMKNNIETIYGKCSNGAPFQLYNHPAWYIDTNSSRHNQARVYANKHGGRDPRTLIELFCSRSK